MRPAGFSRRALLALALGAAGLAGAAGPVGAAGPRRVISIGCDITEIVAALGALDRLVAVDTTSRFPVEVRALPTIGYMRALAAEGILSLRPDLIVASGKSGPDTAVAQLRAAGAEVLLLPAEEGLAAMRRRIAAIAAALGVPDRGAALTAGLDRRFAAIAAVVAGIEQRPSVVFIFGAGNHGAPIAAGTGTTPDAMIALAGARNAVTGYANYKPLTPEAAVAARPDFILTTDGTADRFGGVEGMARLPQLAVTAAARERRIVTLEGTIFSGLGPRTPEAVVELIRRFHAGHPALAGLDALGAADRR